MAQSEDAPPITGQNTLVGGEEPNSATRYDNICVAGVQKVAQSEDAPPTRFCHVATDLSWLWFTVRQPSNTPYIPSFLHYFRVLFAI